MQYVNFGSAGVKVSRVALGLGLRGQGDEKEARNLVAAALDLGGKSVRLRQCLWPGRRSPQSRHVGDAAGQGAARPPR